MAIQFTNTNGTTSCRFYGDLRTIHYKAEHKRFWGMECPVSLIHEKSIHFVKVTKSLEIYEESINVLEQLFDYIKSEDPIQPSHLRTMGLYNNRGFQAFKFVLPVYGFSVPSDQFNFNAFECNPFNKNKKQGIKYDTNTVYFLIYQTYNYPSIETLNRVTFHVAKKIVYNLLKLGYYLYKNKIMMDDLNVPNILIKPDSGRLYLIDVSLDILNANEETPNRESKLARKLFSIITELFAKLDQNSEKFGVIRRTFSGFKVNIVTLASVFVAVRASYDASAGYRRFSGLHSLSIGPTGSRP